MQPPYDTTARIISVSRELWQGHDEAPAVRQIAYDLAAAFAAQDPDFNESAFVLACGYEWPRYSKCRDW